LLDLHSRYQHNQSQPDVRHISPVFKVDDIFAFRLAISGIIRVKTWPVSLWIKQLPSKITQRPALDLILLMIPIHMI
jgi:hypothetical protein